MDPNNQFSPVDPSQQYSNPNQQTGQQVYAPGGQPVLQNGQSTINDPAQFPAPQQTTPSVIDPFPLSSAQAAQANGAPIASSANSGVGINKFIVIGIIVGTLFLIAVVAVLAIPKGGKQPSKNDTSQSQTNKDITGASKTDIQAVNNAITNDLSSLNDEDELIKPQLDDKTLGL